ncbi:MAG: SpoIIE family protein phosphatase [Bacteroidetes bacterium]|nr:SpoIIE family protein phosphatase [Bacteroidota bacterium]
MKNPLYIFRILFFTACCFFFLIVNLSSTLLFAQPSTEKGFYPTRNYTTKDYLALPQNWAIVQDKRGVLYFSNNQCILEYDGVNWRQILVTNESNIRSLCMDSTGVIYVGAQDEFGFLQSDSSGNMRYNSLTGLISDNKDKEFGDVWTCYATREGIFFQTSQKIFRYKDKTIKVWLAEETQTFHKMFYVHNRLLVRQRSVGLLELSGERLLRLPGGELFAEENIYFMVPFSPVDERVVLLNTSIRGLFTMALPPGESQTSEYGSELIVLKSFPTQIDPFFFRYKIYNGILVQDDAVSVGTINKGIAVINRKGQLVDFLSKEIGLQDETIYSQFLDKEHNLWLGLNNGITRVDITSPITIFNDNNGLSGVVQSIARFKDTLYTATNLGVFYLVPRSLRVNEKNPKPEYPRFVQIKDFSDECWALLSFRHYSPPHLLVASNTGIYQIENNKARLLVKPNTWVLHRSEKDSNRVFAGYVDGFASFYWSRNKWVYEGAFPEFEEEIQSLAEDPDGNLWLGGPRGVFRATLKYSGGPVNNGDMTGQVVIDTFGTKNGILSDYVYVSRVQEKVIFAAPGYLFHFDGENFIHDSSFGTQFIDNSSGVHRIIEDDHGNIWLPNYTLQEGILELGFATKNSNGKYEFITKPFAAFSDELPYAIYPEPNTVWLGSTVGILRFDYSVLKKYDIPFNSIIRKVINEDSVIFNGTYYDKDKISSVIQPHELKVVLPYLFNSLNFEFSSASYSDEAKSLYSYYLEGFDKNWSEWSNETKAVYTNFPEGLYYFRVKAKNIYGNESTEAVYEFTILPPWHRTWWAYTGYVLFFIGFVYGSILVSTRGLQKIIRERTAEVVKQKEVIEAKNRDILDSINYAKRIQDALLPHPPVIRKMFRNYFILYKPRDIVSGDFYWCAEKNGKMLITAADCTGHGVPGAFMSMIGHQLLNEIVGEKAIVTPALILENLRQGIIRALGQTGQTGEQKDGMDMALLALDYQNMTVEYAGANNPLYIVRGGEVLETKADKMPIGIYGGIYKIFTNHTIPLQKGDKLIMSSDGYGDQFGGPDGKKFMKKRFKELIISVADQPMERQKEVLDKTIEDWKTTGNTAQMDDILVIGIEI